MNKLYNLLGKYGQLFAFGLGLLITLIYLVSVFGGLDDFNMLSKEDRGGTGIFDFGLKASIVLVIICVVIMLLFGLTQMFSNLKASMKSLIGFGIIALIFIITYSTATMETSGKIVHLFEKNDITENISKLITAGIKTTLILGGLSLAIFALSEVRNFFK